MAPRRLTSAVVCGILVFVGLGGEVGAQARSPRVTFTRDIAPILFTSCANCHRPGEVAPFSLLTYADVKGRAKLIAATTKRRFMPPWKPEPSHEGFIGERRLRDEQIELIQQWVEQGAVEGDPGDLPAVPRWPEGWRLGTPDLVVNMPEPYALAGSTDTFRIFVLPVPITKTRYVRGFEFRPGNPRVVHHASIRVDKTGESRRLDDADPAPGYEGLIRREASYPDGHFLGWTPGQLPPLEEKDVAWRLDPRTDIVLQLHLRPSGKVEDVQSSIGLFFSDEPPTRTPVIIRLGRQSIDIPAGEDEYVSEDSYVLPVDAEVHSVQPHTHYRGRDVEGWAILPNGERKSLIHIKNWDFNWQDVYRYVRPIPLPKGTTLAMRYTFDNSAGNPRNPVQPPQRVISGQRSSDEMGDLWIQMFTRNESDRATLNRDFRPKMVREDIEGYKMLLSLTPDVPGLHDDLALLYADIGDLAHTVEEFAVVLALKPTSPPAHYNLGVALALAGRSDEAVRRYREALTLDPRYMLARNNLGVLLLARGELEQAIAEFREALRLEPDHAEFRNNLGGALTSAGRPAEALEHLRRSLELTPDYAEALYNMGLALTALGNDREAAEFFRRARMGVVR